MSNLTEPTFPRCGSRIVGAISLALLASLGAIAQDASTPSYLPSSGETVQLDKFVVTGRREVASYVIKQTVTGTKTDTPLVDVPQSMTVITRELIDDQGMRGMVDLARYVPGMGIAQGEGNRDTPVMRGNSTTADFFLDGTRDDVEYIRDFYNVDRVEILKGPNAMIFGRGGSGGVVNRVTKQATGVTKRELSVQTGSWDQYRATLDVGQAINPSSAFRVTGAYENADSYRDGVTLERYGFNPTFSWAVAPRTTLRLGYEHFHDERTADRGISSYQNRPVDTAPSTFFGDPAQNRVGATVDSVYGVLEHQFANGASLRNNTRFGSYEKFYQNIVPGVVNAAGTTVALTAYANATNRDNLFNQTDVVFPFATGSVKHQVLTGLELGRQETDNLRQTGYFQTVSPTTTSISVPLDNPRTTLPVTFRPSATDASNDGVAETVAVYAQDQIALTPHWLAIVGARFENFGVSVLNRRNGLTLESRDDMLSPRAGLIFKPEENVSIYTSYSMTYVPRAGQQLASLSLTNQSLDPEEFENLEIGLKWDFHSDLAFTAALYQLDRNNVAVPDPADPTKSLLVDGQRSEGVELGVTGRIGSGWSIAGGYAYQNGEIKTTQSATIVAGARLAQLPRHSLSLWNRYDLNRSWGVGVGAIYRDEIYASTDNTVKLPGFVRFDAAVFWRLNAHFRAQLNVENVFDQDYYATAQSNTNITPGSPRAWRVSVTAGF